MTTATKPLSDSTKRTIRTVVEIVLALASAVPSLAAHLPYPAVAGQVVVVGAAVTKLWAYAEERGWVPSWLK